MEWGLRERLTFDLYKHKEERQGGKRGFGVEEYSKWEWEDWGVGGEAD
jgi:hypothetical protein